MKATPGASVADKLAWKLSTGRPYKAKVERVMDRLRTAKLVEQYRGKWRLTKAGKEA